MAITLAESLGQWQSHGHLFVVADGMGAHAAGELASKLATDTIPHAYIKGIPELSPSESITSAVRQANEVIYNKGQDTVDFQGMGTTCSCLLLLPSGALVSHVGDSRIYRLRGEEFQQLTFDHSLVWEMAAAGHSSEEEVPAYVPKNVITRSLGPHPTVAVDLEGPFALQSGDRFLLCSDGLTGPLSPQLIGMVLATHAPNEAAQTLVDLANLLGGPDNITVVLAEVLDRSKLGNSATPDLLEISPSAVASRSSVSPLVWAAVGIAAVSACLFAIKGDYEVATGCGGALVILTMLAWLRRVSGGEPRASAHSIGLQGKAPYRCHTCTPNAPNIETLTDIVRQLEDLEDHRDWDFDWKPIHTERLRAHQAIAKGDYPGATIAYCSSVRRLMQAIRDANMSQPSDSTIDLG